MFEEDRAPVTLSEIYSQSASCQRTVELAGWRRRSLDQFIPLDALLVCFVSSAALGCAAQFDWGQACNLQFSLSNELHIARLTPGATKVLLNV